jgi:fatty acid desaturase
MISDVPRWRKAYYVLILVLLGLSYRGYVRGSWLGLLAFGTCSWLMGAMGHDGAHFSCSRVPLMNQLCGLGMSLICSPLMWYHQHTFGHHSFTNDFEHDPDLHHFNFLRTHERYEYEPKYRYQAYRLYVYLQYLMVAFGETLWIPLKLIFSGTIHGVTDLPQFGLTGLIAAGLHMALYLFAVVWVPARCLEGVKAVAFPIGYIFTCGLYFGIFSQINHLNEHSISAAAPGRSWAVNQVETSTNFANHSWVWFILSNGLNFQIEHHLFPSINHEHLHLIQPVVIETCRQFGVRYKSLDSLRSILQETALYYQRLSTPA